MKYILFFLGTITTVFFTNCNFNASSSGSIQLKTTKDSLDIVLEDVRKIIEKIDHKTLKKEISEKYSGFDEKSINNINIRYTKFWEFGEENTDATVIIRVNISCSASEFEKASEIIKYYEGYIIPKLKENGYKPKDL